MAENTKTPPPPLPFGDTSELPRGLIDQAKTTADEMKSITQLNQLVGQRLYERLNIRGEIGLQNLTQDPSTAANIQRQPFILTCQRWIQNGQYIIWHANPGEIQWQVPQRSAPQKVRVGEILHIWKDRFRGTYYDEPRLTINFQSGNIMPIRQKPLQPDNTTRQTVSTILPAGEKGTTGPYIPRFIGEEEPRLYQEAFVEVPGLRSDPSETEPMVPPGLDNFYAFLALVDEQKILPEGDINYVYWIYNSRIFPSITFTGLFTPDGANWTDSADNPNQINSWSATFTVYDSYPRLNDYNGLVRFFQAAGFGRI